MLRWIAVVVLCSVLLPWVALAQGMEELPKWHMTGDEACYGFDDAKKLLQGDLRLRECRSQGEAYRGCLVTVKSFQDEIIARTTLENELNRQLNLQAQALRSLTEANERYKYLLIGVGAGALVLGVLAGVYVAR